jgi:hypothetical protein
MAGTSVEPTKMRMEMWRSFSQGGKGCGKVDLRFWHKLTYKRKLESALSRLLALY